MGKIRFLEFICAVASPYAKKSFFQNLYFLFHEYSPFPSSLLRLPSSAFPIPALCSLSHLSPCISPLTFFMLSSFSVSSSLFFTSSSSNLFLSSSLSSPSSPLLLCLQIRFGSKKARRTSDTAADYAKLTASAAAARIMTSLWTPKRLSRRKLSHLLVDNPFRPQWTKSTKRRRRSADSLLLRKP